MTSSGVTKHRKITMLYVSPCKESTPAEQRGNRSLLQRKEAWRANRLTHVITQHMIDE